jgi:hypothetical protein
MQRQPAEMTPMTASRKIWRAGTLELIIMAQRWGVQ